MRYLLLIGLLGINFYSSAQVMTVITTLHDGSRDTIKCGYVQNATLGEDVDMGEENVFMTPVEGYEGRILQRDQDNFSCAMLYDHTPIYYPDNFDSKVNYRDLSDTSLQNRLFETWYSDNDTDSLEMICDIPIRLFLHTAYLYVDDCNGDPPSPVGILIIEDDTATQIKAKLTMGLGIKQQIYIINPDLILTSQEDITIDKKSSDINIYPNPAQHTFTIQPPGHETMVDATIYNSVGQLLYKQFSNTSTAEIDIEGYSYGIYTIVIELSDGSRVVKRLLKQ